MIFELSEAVDIAEIFCYNFYKETNPLRSNTLPTILPLLGKPPFLETCCKGLHARAIHYADSHTT